MIRLHRVRYWFALVTLTAALGGTPVLADEVGELREEVRQLRELTRQQGEQLRQVQALLQAQQASVQTLQASQEQLALETAALGQVKDTKPVLVLGKGVGQLKLTGDLLVRYERLARENNGVEQSRDAWRQRLRLGAIWQGEEWEIGVGVATGSDSPTSTNDTWSEGKPFETGDLRLDYAYAKHTLGDVTITAGQQRNPYLSSWVLWDGDVRPAGVTVQYEHDGLFVTGGGYDVRHFGNYNEADAYLTALQGGYGGKQGDLSYKGALAYYRYTKATVENNETTDPTPTIDDDDDYSYHLVSLYGEASQKLGERASAGLFGEYIKNLAAEGTAGQVAGVDPGGNDTAWILGAKAGYDKLRLTYAYAHIEADSVYNQLNEATFAAPLGATTDAQGHVINVAYDLTPNLALGLTAYYTEAIERSNPDDGEVYYLDASWKF